MTVLDYTFCDEKEINSNFVTQYRFKKDKDFLLMKIGNFPATFNVKGI